MTYTRKITLKLDTIKFSHNLTKTVIFEEMYVQIIKVISFVTNTLLKVITLHYHYPSKLKCDSVICNPNNICS